MVVDISNKQIKYPVDCTKAVDKTEFLYLAQETLRLQHNEMGRKFREGVISRKEWDNYVNTVFNPRSDIIVRDILECRGKLKHSKKYTVDLDNLWENSG